MENRIPLLKLQTCQYHFCQRAEMPGMLERSPPHIHKADEIVILGLVDPTHAALIAGVVA